MALSTYLALPDALAVELQAVNRSTPIFMAHGTDDPIAPFTVAQASRDQLTALGCPVAFHSYRMPHSMCPDEVVDIRAWLCKILG
jgi:phospholipase/carboxylesterase